MSFKRLHLVSIFFSRCFISKFLSKFSAPVHYISQWYLNVTFLLPNLGLSYVLALKQRNAP